MRRNIILLLIMAVVMIALCACGSSEGDDINGNDNEGENVEESKDDAVSLKIAYQSSIAYAPLNVMQDMELIEKYYDGAVEVVWTEMSSGAAINEGITAGDIDVGAMGVAPAIIGVKAGIPYKIFSGISSQPYGIMTNQENVNTLEDITKEHQLSVVALNSMPHILLAMAADHYLGDPRALDGNLVALSNSDGYTSLISGATQCQMCISPYNFMLAEEESIHAIEVSEEVWSNGDTFIVGMASIKLYEENPALYEALCQAMEEAMEYIAENMEDTATLVSGDYDVDAETILEWMNDPASTYTTKLQGVMELADFMVGANFLEEAPTDMEEIAFTNVEGE